MKKAIVAAIAAAVIPTVSIPAIAQAGPDYSWRGDHGNNWDASRSYHPDRRYDRRMTRSDYVYRGGDGRYYCRRNNGTTGLVVGGVAGGLMGNAIGGSALSTLLGAAGGAALGSSIDRGQVHCR